MSRKHIIYYTWAMLQGSKTPPKWHQKTFEKWAWNQSPQNSSIFGSWKVQDSAQGLPEGVHFTLKRHLFWGLDFRWFSGPGANPFGGGSAAGAWPVGERGLLNKGWFWRWWLKECVPSFTRFAPPEGGRRIYIYIYIYMYMQVICTMCWQLANT